jgi:hypothetical protein
MTVDARPGATDLALQFAAMSAALTAGGSREDALRRLVALAVEAVPGCSSAGVTAWPEGQRPRSLAASDDVATAADALQHTLGEGPCLEAAADAELVRSPDLLADERWPRLRARLEARTPVRGVVAVELARDPERRALNVYATEPGVLTDASVDVAVLVGAHARVLLAQAESADAASSLQRALGTSRQIGTAVGILMTVHKVTSEEAFALLTRSSQHLNRKLRDVADDVTSTGTLPGS